MPSYTAVVLDEKSRDALLTMSGVRENDQMQGWKEVAEHMTMFMGSDGRDQVLPLLGKVFTLEVTAFGSLFRSEGVGIAAVQVECEAPSKNSVKHITVARHKDVPAKTSNEITEWTRLATPLRLTGIVQEVRR